MNPKNEDIKQSSKIKTAPKNSKSNLTNINTNNNNNNNIINTNNKRNSKTNILSSKDSKQYNVQLTILDESKKLKINLEITEGQKIKRIYITTLTLEELISLNNFFSQFKEYSEAFDFLLKNFTKIDRNKITYSNNNNDITIILLFALGEEDNELIEESIEITLHRYTGNQMNKSLSNINSVINNLKSSLEKFNISIKELKTNVNKDKIEKDKRINELEQIFHNKINEIKKEIINYNSKGEDKENLENKFDEIYNKIEEHNINIEDIKKSIEENDINQRNEIEKNNKVILDKENELAQLITEKFNDFIIRINSYDEKSIEMENNFNDKLTDLDNKTNICFNELIKKINVKNENKIIPENNYKEELNETINYLVEENENLEKRLENKLEEKINNIMISKIKNLEEKINQLEKNIGKDNNIKNELNNEVNILIKEKFDDFEQYKLNLLKNIEKNETDINENKIKINDINEKINELFEHVNNNKEINLDEIKNEINDKMNEINENNKNIDEIKNSIKNDLEQEYNNKIEETKKEINKIINNINETIKNNSTELKNKIELFKNDISKNNDEKNNKIEEKLNKLEKKYSSKESKSSKKHSNNQIVYDINNNTNNNSNNKNYINIDQTLKYMEYKKDIKSKNKEKYSSKTLDNDENKFGLKKLRKQSSNKNNILSKTLPELNPENSDSNNKTEKDSDSSSKKNIRNSYFVSSYNLFSSRLRARPNVFDLFIDTNILKKEDITENFFIFTKLKEIYAYNRYIKLNLIYRASRDGDNAKDFHFKCDFIGPNLTVIKTKKEYIFGGFTIKTWKHLFKDINSEDPECGTELKDEQAFGFSVNKNKIYENGKQDEGIIYCNSNYGPCFKNFFFKIFDKCFENGGICGTVKESNFIGIEKDFEINGGERNFDVEEIEVFQIAFR